MTTALDIGEAIPLAYALVARLTMDLGVRALLIKGPVLTQQRLRGPRVSADVDLLVEPASFEFVKDALADLGWLFAGPFDTPTVLPAHSHAVRHSTWPCEIDVHREFPGFLAPPSEVFDLLWNRRTQASVASQWLPAPDPAAHAMIAALHYLRDTPYVNPKFLLDELSERVKVELGPPGVAEIGTLVSLTGSAHTLRPFTDRLGLAEPGPGTTPDPVAWRAWQLHMQTQTVASLNWVVELGRVPWRRKPWVAWHGLWPSADEMRRHAGVPLETARELRDARQRRLRRGLRELPQAVREVRQSGRAL